MIKLLLWQLGRSRRWKFRFEKGTGFWIARALQMGRMVGRWSALAFGLVYGYSHNASLQKHEEEKRKQLEYQRKEQLIEKARLEYAKKKGAATAAAQAPVADVDSPDFDLEKFIAQLESSESK
ncbi:hypothetical protein VTP01DRAFT_7355 [Rhizomucor pusillus]|uniref:uncharacterized protein n=1 Tax=Rhizomucor pusillus TaxID=4840 RepID=UPI003742F894